MNLCNKIDNILNEDNEEDDIKKIKSILRKIDSRKYSSKNISSIINYISIQSIIVSAFLNKDKNQRRKIINKAISLRMN